MRTPVFTLALAALFAIPAIAAAQDRKEVQPTSATPAAISDLDIAPIAEAIRRGEPVSRIETDWRALLERHADGLREGDAHVLTLRVLEAAWKPTRDDLDQTAREMESTDRCADEGGVIERERAEIERALSAGKDASEGDVRNARAALAALSEAMRACQETLSRDRQVAEKEAVDRKLAALEEARAAPVDPEIEDAAVEEEEAPVGVSAVADQIQSAAQDDQLAQFEIQSMMQQQQQYLHSLSNALKASHAIAMAIIQNLRS